MGNNDNLKEEVLSEKALENVSGGYSLKVCGNCEKCLNVNGNYRGKPMKGLVCNYSGSPCYTQTVTFYQAPCNGFTEKR